MRLSLPGLSLVNHFYLAAQAEGLEDLGTQGLYRVLARLNDSNYYNLPLGQMAGWELMRRLRTGVPRAGLQQQQ